MRLQRAGYPGRLSLRRGEGEKSIFFDGGFPVHATSNLPHDRLGELLWREGKISAGKPPTLEGVQKQLHAMCSAQWVGRILTAEVRKRRQGLELLGLRHGAERDDRCGGCNRFCSH